MIPVRENSEVVIIYPEKLLFTVRSGIVLHHLNRGSLPAARLC
jgi:hypothetical protein